MLERLHLGVQCAFATTQNDAFGVPVPPVECFGADVLGKAERRLDCNVEKIQVADHLHTLDVKTEFVRLGIANEYHDRGSHLQERVTQEFEPLVVLPHAALKLYLLFAMFFGVVRVFRHCLQCQLRCHVKIKLPARLCCNKI